MRKLAGIEKIKTAVERLYNISMLRRRKHVLTYNDIEDDCGDSGYHVPEDVKEGHFAVITMDGDQLERYVVPLSCLSHPRIVRLLEQAAEEYDFGYKGALVIPCKAGELSRILAKGAVSEESSDEETNQS